MVKEMLQICRLTRQLLFQNGSEGGKQVLQQLFKAPPEETWCTAICFCLYHNLAQHIGYSHLSRISRILILIYHFFSFFMYPQL